MGNRTTIEKLNENWISKKVKYEKTHRYSGDPDIMINRFDVRLTRESSSESKDMRN